MPKIVLVVPTIRETQYRDFQTSWKRLLDFYEVQTVTVWDGDEPELEVNGKRVGKVKDVIAEEHQWLLCNKTDACRNSGFLWAAEHLDMDYLLTLDDDVRVLPSTDPIGEHLSVLNTRVSTSWMNTGIDGVYYRGFPYETRNDCPVKVSHGCWVGVPDLDAPTQLMLMGNINATPKFYRGAIPAKCFYPHCGMNVMFTADAVPLAYYAPMGETAGYSLNRFADIFHGIRMKRRLDQLGWAVVSGYSIIHHSRASDTFVNLAQEAEGLRLNETYWKGNSDHPYFLKYEAQAVAFEDTVRTLLSRRAVV